eukprot:333419_1
MGSLFPGLHGTKHRAELRESIHIEKPISISIYQCIDRESAKCNAVLPHDIIVLCITYTRFIMHSNILHHGEQNRFYQLLMNHYQNQKIHPHLNICSKSIQYFHLLYRASLTDGDNQYQDIDCCQLLSQCKNKDHLVMLFHTEYDHVFSLYFRMEFNMRFIGPKQNKHDHVALFLLRSQFIYGDKQQNIDLANRLCPRIVELRKGRDIEDVLLKGVLCEETGRGWFDTADLKMGLQQTAPRHVSHPCAMDFIGNELCGGHQFESPQNRYAFRLKEAELFQIC